MTDDSLKDLAEDAQTTIGAFLAIALEINARLAQAEAEHARLSMERDQAKDNRDDWVRIATEAQNRAKEAEAALSLVVDEDNALKLRLYDAEAARDQVQAQLEALTETYRMLSSAHCDLLATLESPHGAIVPACPSCSMCGGPHPFDTTIPSDIWNAVVRAKGLPEYLCATCILRVFAEAGVSFTANLWGERFNGQSIEVRVQSPTTEQP